MFSMWFSLLKNYCLRFWLRFVKKSEYMDGCRTFDGYNATIFAYGQVVLICIVFHCVIIYVCVFSHVINAALTPGLLMLIN